MITLIFYSGVKSLSDALFTMRPGHKRERLTRAPGQFSAVKISNAIDQSAHGERKRCIIAAGEFRMPTDLSRARITVFVCVVSMPRTIGGFKR